MSKIRVYHFHNGAGGGVLTVIRNLLKFSNNPAIENHVIYTINKEEKAVYPVNNLEGAFSEQIFYYSPKWNFYYTCMQLAKLLPDDNALVIAHDWLELGMMSNLGLQNPLVLFLHGDYDYYYHLAQQHEPAIDQFICVAQNIENNLVALLPARKERIAYLRFPVPEVSNKQVLKNDCPIIFIGRLIEGKGYPLLPVIAKELRRKNLNATWHIVGTAGNAEDETIWDKNIDVHFYNNISNDKVLALLPQMKILILPSIAEGMPVVVIEAMKAGVIPIVNDIDGGIQELVIDNITGYKIKDNQVNDFVERIAELIKNRDMVSTMQNNCITWANDMFDPIKNTMVIEDNLVKIYSAKRKLKHAFKAYGSRLDTQWIPNWIVYLLRRLKMITFFRCI